MSSLDQLPLELSWMIFDYVPESILAIRSRQYLNLYITAAIPKTSSNIFKLRVKLSGFPTDQLKQRDRDRSIAYGVSIGATNSKMLDLFGKCMGKRIGLVKLYKCRDNELAAVSKLFRDAKFANLSLTCDILSEDIMKQLFNIIGSHKVDNLSIEVRKVQLPDSVSTLKKLSSLVLSLHIRQFHVKEMPNMQRFFFGALDVDWAPIFIEMLFGKMNELWIENSHYQRYIGNEGVDLLIKYLPRMNKKVSFYGTCKIDELAYNYKHFMRYDYEISITPSDYERSKGYVLRIKHAPTERVGGRRETSV